MYKRQGLPHPDDTASLNKGDEWLRRDELTVKETAELVVLVGPEKAMMLTQYVLSQHAPPTKWVDEVIAGRN